MNDLGREDGYRGTVSEGLKNGITGHVKTFTPLGSFGRSS